MWPTICTSARGVFGVAQAEPDDVLLVQGHQGSGGQRGLHGAGIADRGDRVRRAVGTAVEQQRVADAARRRGGDDPLVLHLDRFGAGTPQRVEHGLDVLLVHHQVVGGGVAREAAVGVALRVVERHDQARAVHRVQAGVERPARPTGLHRRQGGVGRTSPCVESILAASASRSAVEPVHRRLRLPDQVDQPRCVTAPDLAAAGHPVGGGQQQSGQQADQRDPEAPPVSGGCRIWSSASSDFRDRRPGALVS